MNELPTIRIELDGVKESVIHGFRAKQEEIKEYVSRVIEASFNTLVNGGLESAIIRTTEKTLTDVIKENIDEVVYESVSEYFSSDNGKCLILQAIIKGLSQKETK